MFESHAQFRGDDGGERRFAQAGRAVQQDMIHGFAALLGGFDGDAEILFELRLAGEIVQLGGPECSFELALALESRGRNDTIVAHWF